MKTTITLSAAIAGAALFGLGSLSSASAATVTFDTLGSELCFGAAGCGALTQTIGGVRISFEPVGDTTVTATSTPTLSLFGQIVMSCVVGGTGCASQSLAGLNLYIDIDQSGPVAGGGVLSGAFSGAMSGTQSSALLTYGAPVVVGTTTYAPLFSPQILVPANINGGATFSQARITYAEPQPPQTTVPEPAAWALMILGFGAAGTALRRRRPATV